MCRGGRSDPRVARRVIRSDPRPLRDAGASAALARALAGAFESKRISMRRFLEDHLPGASPPHVQAALYCQGLTYHDSRARRAGLPPLSRSHDLLRTLAENDRREVYLARLQRKQGRLAAVAASRRGAVRLAIARAAKAEFMATHDGVPQLFDHAQLARLNATRPPDEQLELMGASPGLLKHHCCYPCCPHFLRDLRSPKDRAAATAAGTATGHGRSAAHFRRHGLFRHLKWFQWPRLLLDQGNACHGATGVEPPASPEPNRVCRDVRAQVRRTAQRHVARRARALARAHSRQCDVSSVGRRSVFTVKTVHC